MNTDTEPLSTSGLNNGTPWGWNAIPALRDWLWPMVAMVAALSIWQLVCGLFSIPEYVLPSPMRIGAEIYAQSDQLLKHTAITLGEAAAGFIFANIFSLAFAVVFCYSPFFEKSTYPYMIAFQSVPIVALAPLINLWFGEGAVSKIVMAGLITFFPMVVNATHGLKAVSPLSLDVMRSLSATEPQILRKLRIPTALPYILAALKISAPLSVIGAIVAELTSANSGIGYLLLVAAYRVETPFLFACITFASLGGIAFFGLAALTGRLLTTHPAKAIVPAERLMDYIRRDLELSEFTVATVNRCGGLEKLRSQVRWPEDAPHINHLTESDKATIRFLGYALHHNPIRQGDEDALAMLQKAWQKAQTMPETDRFQEHMQLMWQILDAENLVDEWHCEIYRFVADNWDIWRRRTLEWSAQGNHKILLAHVFQRLLDREYPTTKAWAYLLQTPISKDPKSVKDNAAKYTGHSHFLVRQVAKALVEASDQDILSGRFCGPPASTLCDSYSKPIRCLR